jgi:predicted nucleic acid-binding protein
MTHLDTSFLIHALVPGSNEASHLRRWTNEAAPVGITSIAWAELLCGPLDDQARALARHVVGDPEPFLADDAETAARLFNSTGRRRGSFVDCMIAAVAIRCDAAVATSNGTDFRRFEPHGLRVLEA